MFWCFFFYFISAIALQLTSSRTLFSTQRRSWGELRRLYEGTVQQSTLTCSSVAKKPWTPDLQHEPPPLLQPYTSPRPLWVIIIISSRGDSGPRAGMSGPMFYRMFYVLLPLSQQQGQPWGPAMIRKQSCEKWRGPHVRPREERGANNKIHDKCGTWLYFMFHTHSQILKLHMYTDRLEDKVLLEKKPCYECSLRLKVECFSLNYFELETQSNRCPLLPLSLAAQCSDNMTRSRYPGAFCTAASLFVLCLSPPGMN